MLGWLLGYKCDNCGDRFPEKEMNFNVMIGPHKPWQFCDDCYSNFMQN